MSGSTGSTAASEEGVEPGQRELLGRRRDDGLAVDLDGERGRVDVDPRQRVVVDHVRLADPAGRADRGQPATEAQSVGEPVVQRGRRDESDGVVGSVGVIVPDTLVRHVETLLAGAGVPHATLGEEPPGLDEGVVEFDVPLDLVPASLAKGLEFDHVVLLEPAGIVAGEADRTTGLRRLYVCLTRAVTSLVVAHERSLPEELAG